MPRSDTVICEFCDTVYQRATLAPNQRACCSCCGAELYRDRHHDFDVMLALTLTGLAVFVIANIYPIFTLEINGVRNQTTLLHAVLAAYDFGMGPLAIIVAVCVFFFPLLQIGLFIWLLLPLRAGRVPPAFIAAMHALRQMKPWSMVEVFLVGTLVAVVKLQIMATVIPQTGLWGFAALTCLITALHSFDLHQLWDRAEAIGAGRSRMSELPRATDLGLIQCPACGLVLRFDVTVHGAARGVAHCSRCALPLQRRKTNSLQRSWAFLIAATILYLPANLLPVMHRRQLLDIASDTILSGVIELWKAGSWDLAVIVFTASIVVPILKIGTLTFLLISTQRGSAWARRERTRLYRIIEFVGHWSMLDVFVVALLVTLVHFGIIAQVQPGGGIIAFGAVVVLTMLASQSFDPRLIWDEPMDERTRPAQPTEPTSP